MTIEPHSPDEIEALLQRHDEGGHRNPLAFSTQMAAIIRQQRSEIEGLREEVKHLTHEKEALQNNIEAAQKALVSHCYLREWKPPEATNGDS